MQHLLEINESLHQVQQQSEHLKQQLTRTSGKKYEGREEENRDLQQHVSSKHYEF